MGISQIVLRGYHPIHKFSGFDYDDTVFYIVSDFSDIPCVYLKIPEKYSIRISDKIVCDEKITILNKTVCWVGDRYPYPLHEEYSEPGDSIIGWCYTKGTRYACKTSWAEIDDPLYTISIEDILNDINKVINAIIREIKKLDY